MLDSQVRGPEAVRREMPCLGPELTVSDGQAMLCGLCGRRMPESEARIAAAEPVASGLEQRLRMGQMLYVAGRRTDAVFVMRRGLAKETLDVGTSRRVVRLVGPGSVTGLPSLLGEVHRRSAIVIGAGLACRIPVAGLQQWAGRDARVAGRVARLWQEALDDADRLTLAYGCGPASARLARFVLFLADAIGPGARLCRREASELIGVTPVSVTRLVGDLKRRGLIREEGVGIAAWDAPGLRMLAGDTAPAAPAAPIRLPAATLAG